MKNRQAQLNSGKSITFNTDLFYNSVNEAQRILDHSFKLADAGADAERNYKTRASEIADIVPNGFIQFNPTIEIDYVQDFREKLRVSTVSIDDSSDADKKTISNVLHMNTTNENIIYNTVPQAVIDYLKEYSIKGYSSPKLTKLINKLYGEKSDVVKWFNNHSRTGAAGILDEYIITVSAYPHHIAGMSFYARCNHVDNADRWPTFNGTSCQDPTHNGNGEYIGALPASLKDTTCFIAYLSNSDESDFLTPLYRARVLIRSMPYNGKSLYFVCNAYGETSELREILVRGLLNKYPSFIYGGDMSEKYDYTSNYTTIPYYYDHDIYFVTEEKKECYDCDGAGHVDCDTCEGSGEIWETCHNCDGNGRVQVDCDTCDGAGDIKITCEYCDGSGEIDGEQCQDCDGNGYILEFCPDCGGNGYYYDDCGECDGEGSYYTSCPDCDGTGREECQSCDGDGYTSEEEENTPYIDDKTYIEFARHDKIQFYIPTEILKDCGMLDDTETA